MTALLQNKKVHFLDFSDEKIALLKQTVCKGSSDDELQLFLHACVRTGLDPFMKQIYAIKRGNAMTIQTGIDGYRLIAERTENYSPGKEPSYQYDDNKNLISATAYVKKKTSDGTWHEVCATAFYSEYVQKFDGKPSSFWLRMPHNQLAKCAEALALRKAFPANLSGIYTFEEMGQASVIEEPQVEIQDKNELSLENVEMYLNTWGDKKDKFKIFMDELMKERKWDFSKCIESFKKDPAYTESVFNQWLSKKS
jgi:phage recombination protein Bet